MLTLYPRVDWNLKCFDKIHKKNYTIKSPNFKIKMSLILSK